VEIVEHSGAGYAKSRNKLNKHERTNHDTMVKLSRNAGKIADTHHHAEATTGGNQ